MVIKRLVNIKIRITSLYYAITNKKIDSSVRIKSPIIFTNKKIRIGKNSIIGYHARIEEVFSYNQDNFEPSIEIGENVRIEQNLHLTCAYHISIGNNTAISANVTITDINHMYLDTEIPIENQNIEVKQVIIGKNCKIYNNSVILPGVIIGEHVIIGANSVVNRNIPDFSVVVGSPAKVVKKYNVENKLWEKV
jgi:acetyltransferase-like isoleucine patch superfamily enzyme